MNATVYIDEALSQRQAGAAQKIATWILSLEGTPVRNTVRAPVNINFDLLAMAGSVSRRDILFAASPLRGNDGFSTITVSNPLIFGQFPVQSTVKGVVKKLTVHDLGLSFDYINTNANNAVFEFTSGQVK
jgi:hypothetical protein